MKNITKEKLNRGEVVMGATISMTNLDIVELMSKMNFDWFWFDTEHAPVNSEMLQAMLQVARGGPTPIVRVAWNDQVLIKKALDVGAQGLIVPWVNNRQQAEAAVSAAKYPPEGLRGIGPRWISTSAGDPVEYIQTANDEVLIIVQIETQEAIDNLEDIITTPGVDAYLIGPNDLAASLGYLGQINHPEVEKAFEGIVERGKKAGIPGGFATAPPEYCQKLIEMGFKIITIGGDLVCLRRGLEDVLEKMDRKPLR